VPWLSTNVRCLICEFAVLGEMADVEEGVDA